MKEDLIADMWQTIVEFVPEKHKKDLASGYVDTLLDHGVSASTLDNLLGVDPYLDQAIEYATNDSERYDEEEEDDVDDYDDYED